MKSPGCFSCCANGGEKCFRERPPGESVLAGRSAQTALIGVEAPIWAHSVDAASAYLPRPDMNVWILVYECQLFLWEGKESL